MYINVEGDPSGIWKTIRSQDVKSLIIRFLDDFGYQPAVICQDCAVEALGGNANWALSNRCAQFEGFLLADISKHFIPSL